MIRDDLAAREISETTAVNMPARMTYNLWMQFETFPWFISSVESVLQPDHCINPKAVSIQQLTEPASLIGRIRLTRVVYASRVRGDLAGLTECGEERRNKKRSCQSTFLAGPVNSVVGSASDMISLIRKERWCGGEGDDSP